MTDKLTPEDRHIEAAIRAAGLIGHWESESVKILVGLGPYSTNAETARSIMAHAEMLAMVESALSAIEWEAGRENGNLLHFKRCVMVQLRAALSHLKDK